MPSSRPWLLLLAVCALAIAGCCKNKSGGEDLDIPPVIPSSDPGLEDPGESQRDSKVDRVIKCYNAAMRINKSAEYYYRYLRNRPPGPGRTPFISYKPPPTTNKMCSEAKADVTPPMPDIDSVMPQYVDLITKLTKQLDDMDQYYRTKEYKTDKYAKGKAMHATFKTDHDAFKKLHDKIAGSIDAVADKRDEESIAKESAKKGLRYHSLVFLRDAKYFVREVTKDKPDNNKVGDLKTKVDTSFKAFSAYATGHADEEKKAFMFSLYKSAAEEFIGAVRSATGLKLKSRDIDKILDKYNSMIDRSNRVKWRN